MKNLIFIGTILFTLSAHSSCPEVLKTGIEAYNCILENNPSLQSLRYKTEEIEALSSKAKQIANPELDADVKFSGDKKIEVGLLQPIEIGGKRSSRIARAQAEGSLLSAKNIETRVEASNTALESLIRFRQLKTESALVKDSLSILNRINQRLKNRLGLSPEQKNASRLFSTFEKTLRFKQLSIESDYQKTKTLIESVINRTITDNDNISVGTFKKWPTLDTSALGGQTVALQVSMAEVELAKSELKEAQSESWPDLRIGPSVEQLPEQNETSWGLKVGMTLPLWNLNGAGRNLANSRLSSANLFLEATKRQQRNQLDILQTQYKNLTKILTETEPASEVVNSVKESERLFERSLISPSSLIEMYRSTFELVEEIHRNEIAAMLIWSTAETTKGTFLKELP